MRLFYGIEVIFAYVLYFTGLYGVRRKLLEKRGVRIVLVYHRVLDGKRRWGEMVGEEALEWQMRHLRERHHPVDWETIVSPADSVPGIRVLVTFDDGYRDSFTRALPILERHRIPAIFFAATNFIFKRQTIEDGQREGENDLFPSGRDLQRAKESPCVTFGNHTASHVIVSTVGLEAFEEELRSSQKEFFDKLNVTPKTFAYPRGREEDINAGAISILEKLDFRAAFTMIPGFVDARKHRFLMPRIGMSHVNNKILFKVKMLGLLNPLVRSKNLLKL